MLIHCLSLALLTSVVGPQTNQPTTKKPATAQEHTGSMQATRYQTTRFAALEDLADAKVELLADYEDRAEAAEDGERADRPEASIDDLLIDHRNGRIAGAVVSVGGFIGIGDKKVAVPYDALRWNAQDECFTLSATEEQLKSMAAFDADRARRDGVEPMMLPSSRAVESSAKKDMHTKDKDMHDGQDTMAGKQDMHGKEHKDQQGMDKDGTRSVTVGDKRFAHVNSGLCLASKLDGETVYASDKEFGDISRLIVDRETGKIEFAVVKHGGVAGMGTDKIVVPFKSLSYCRVDDGKVTSTYDGTAEYRLDDDKDGERVLCVRRTATELEAGVPYEEPEEGVIDADTARRVEQRFADRG
jgi:hypothetical protein